MAESPVIVACVEPHSASSIWDRVREMIDAGYAYGGDFMPEDMLERLRYGKTLLWIAVENREGGEILAAMTTELIPMRGGLTCWMCQCGGERAADWARFHTQIEEYARAEGCVKTILRGRPGWQRFLEGYTVRTVQLEKTL